MKNLSCPSLSATEPSKIFGNSERLERQQVSEERWVAYFDEVYSRSEVEAIQTLQREGYIPADENQEALW